MGDFAGSVDWIRGRIHLSCLSDNYKKQIELEEENTIAEALKTTTNQVIPIGLISRRKKSTRRKRLPPITIDSDYLINQFEPTQNCMAAIAAVDYAMKDTKPTCSFVMES